VRHPHTHRTAHTQQQLYIHHRSSNCTSIIEAATVHPSSKQQLYIHHRSSNCTSITEAATVHPSSLHRLLCVRRPLTWSNSAGGMLTHGHRGRRMLTCTSIIGCTVTSDVQLLNCTPIIGCTGHSLQLTGADTCYRGRRVLTGARLQGHRGSSQGVGSQLTGADTRSQGLTHAYRGEVCNHGYRGTGGRVTGGRDRGS
jgi:hypothetical protein